MRRDHVKLYSPAIAADGELIAYGHHGRPLLVFPSENGRPWDYEDRGMIDGIANLIEAGRVKVYCVDSYDSASWQSLWLSPEDRARAHLRYEDWIINQVVPWIYDDCRGQFDVMVNGCSFGAYHAANFALKRADFFPLALCHSGLYDVSALSDGERGDSFYFNNPMDYVANMWGPHLDWLRSRVHLVLVCGRGQWEDTTGALQSTHAFAALLAGKGIPHELDLWGYDVPHDWPSWRSQLAHHLPRFC
jgi:esterase/lipase superfamily enzyme